MARLPAAIDTPAAREAIGATRLAGLPPATLSRLFDGATAMHVDAGTVLRGVAEPGPHLELVVRGFVRIFVHAADGRALTVRYCRPGALMGSVSIFRRSYAMLGSLQALVDTDLVVLRPAVVRQIAAEDVGVAGAFLEELSDRLLSFFAEIPSSAFDSVRQRTERHLLDLASENQHGAELFAPITQQALADAVGSVREVVVRVLRQLRTEGVVSTRRSGVVILAPEKLAPDGARGT